MNQRDTRYHALDGNGLTPSQTRGEPSVTAGGLLNERLAGSAGGPSPNSRNVPEDAALEGGRSRLDATSSKAPDEGRDADGAPNITGRHTTTGNITHDELEHHEHPTLPDTTGDAAGTIGEDDANKKKRPRGGKKRKAPVSYLRLPRHKRSKNIGKKKTKAYLNIVTQNVKGRGGDDMRRNPKWGAIACATKRDKIGVFAVQETHLTAEHVAELEEAHEHLKIINSPDPRNPTGAGGVAIVLNRRTVDTGTLRHWVIEKGRAIIVSFRWHKDQELAILAVYAPTDERENRTMWESIHNTLKSDKSIPRPQVMLGDFNFVEDALDRFPVHLNGIDSPESFDELKDLLHLTDGWRATFETEVNYTWRNKARTQQSRLDRIYMTNPLLATTRKWSIEVSDLTETDHCRVSTQLVCVDVPEEGDGRWTMRKRILKNKDFIADVQRAGKVAEAQLEDIERNGRTDERNAQIVWDTFKKAVIAAARKYSNLWSFGPNKHVAELERKRRAILNAHKKAMELECEEDESPEDEEALDFELDGADIDIPRDTREIEELIEEEYTALNKKKRDDALTDKSITAETTEKKWFAMAKEYKARDKILALQTNSEGEPQYTSRSDEMAQVARDYHDSLQDKDIHQDVEERRQAINEVLSYVESVRDKVDLSELERGINEEDVASSLKDSKNGKAAGTDGLIYELWKEIHRIFASGKVDAKDCTNIVAVMTAVFRDIELHGLIEGSTFTEGWLCPLYKKGERTSIANYRPITLLNTDYKIYTKALAMKLAKIAPDIIHNSQAGFVKGRVITDHIHLARMMVTYAEAEETENGMILALDQEKAYDKIAHDFLDEVLVKMGLPVVFTDTVKSLYAQAQTVVIINGETSKPFRVRRGVRQGDPLSCLLFNFAIEPLAAMLRRSTLQGWKIPGQDERLIAILYADDTSIFLRDDDSMEVLNRILRTWCIAATAKFNQSKTECVPLGDKEYRKHLIETRKTMPQATALPPEIKIAADGTAVRILGGWIGNEVDDAAPWTPILDKARARLERWHRFFPTIQGRRILCRCIIGGMTQYLTAAQGMPKKTEDRFVKLLVDFFWENKKHTVNEATIYLPETSGGMNILDLRSRNEAIYATWAKKLYTDSTEGPTWKHFARAIVSRHATKESSKGLPEPLRGNMLTQTWHPNEHKLPAELRHIEKLRKDYGILIDAPLLPYDVQTEMPIWDHFAKSSYHVRGRRTDAAIEAEDCLRDVHEIRTVGDALELALPTEIDHEMDNPECACDDCCADRDAGCSNPTRCQNLAQEMIASLPPKWNPYSEQSQDGLELSDREKEQNLEDWRARREVRFDASYETSDHMDAHIRIFTAALAMKRTAPLEQAQRNAGIRPPPRQAEGRTTAYICGTITRNATTESKGAYAVHFPEWEYLDEANTLPDERPDEERATLMAVIRTCSIVDRNKNLLIVCSNKHVVRNLTVRREYMDSVGWVERPEAEDLYRHAVAILRSRGGKTALRHVTLKDQDEEMLETHRLATDEMDHTDPGARTKAPANYDVIGLSLKSLTQRMAYRAIRLIKARKVPIRSDAKVGLDRAQYAAAPLQGAMPTDVEIWKSLKHPDIRRNVQDFLWLCTQDGQRTGKYFLRMQALQWQARADCRICDVPDTLEHILFDCYDPARTQVWSHAEETWKRVRGDWPKITLGTVLACGLVQVTDGAGQASPGPSRLLRILISEAAHLIWCLNRERVIKHAEDPDWRQPTAKIEASWFGRLNDRLTVDRLGTNRYKYGHRTLDKKLVLQTWTGLIENEKELPEDWTKQSGVLVGRGNIRPAGRNR